LKQLLSQRTKLVIRDKARRPAAVLIPLFYEDGEYQAIFTKRTERVSHHKGEISFPGGSYSPKDGDLLTTALRESCEEIGLAVQDVEVLGELDDIVTKGSPYIISPFVGIIPAGYSFKTSTFEIAELITVPVPALLRPEGCSESPDINVDGRLITTYVYTYQNHNITGATARILKQFLGLYLESLA
jgi:8-oxo-dGTP pyrophosphatase MutT (NUDIX family)